MLSFNTKIFLVVSFMVVSSTEAEQQPISGFPIPEKSFSYFSAFKSAFNPKKVALATAGTTVVRSISVTLTPGLS